MDGIVLIDKPKGFTSRDAVAKVKKILNEKKVGHTGTLDPLATGVLPVLLGEYTKFSKYLIEHDKVYKVTLKLGIETETGDLEGKVLSTDLEFNKEKLSSENVKNILKSFEGKSIQTPPIYSAIKVNGKKLYEYARNGEKVDIPSRQIEIYSIILHEIDLENLEIKFTVNCSKGTYIRSLCVDLAKKIGTVGVMSDLRRIKVGNFEIENAYDFSKLDKENVKLYGIEDILREYKTYNLPLEKEKYYLNGVMISENLEDGIYKIYVNNKCIGTGIVKNKLLKRDIVI